MRTISALFSIAVLTLASWIPLGPPEGGFAAPRESFVVNSNADDANAHDWLPGDGMCADSQWRCTLRAAIEEANALAGADMITFSAAMIIQVDAVEGALPAITDRLRIDASGAWNSALDRPGVTLDGGNQSFTGLFLMSGYSEVYGLAISNFLDGIYIYRDHCTVGGPGLGQRNVIGGNRGGGIAILDPNAHHNVIQGNWIGLSLSGTAADSNEIGVTIARGAHDNLVGGQVWGEGNYIAGNTKYGVDIYQANTDNNQVFGNVIGLPASGAADAGNGLYGVFVHNGPQNTQVGSTIDIAAGNYIEGNLRGGVSLAGTNNNWVENNHIRENRSDGVQIKNGSGNRLLSNEIAYNDENGVWISGATATGNALMANSIHHNAFSGIDLLDGGNAELNPPVIAAASSFGAYGTACANCIVHLFSDYADEGEAFEGFANVDASGKWVFVGYLGGPNVTATVTDQNGNTSEFSKPKNIYALYMPVARKKN